MAKEKAINIKALHLHFCKQDWAKVKNMLSSAMDNNELKKYDVLVLSIDTIKDLVGLTVKPAERENPPC